MRRLSLPLLLALAALAAGCGSTAPDPKPVAEAWAHALGRTDFVKVCNLLTPGVRSVMNRYSDRHSERGCRAQARHYLGAAPADRAGLLAARARAVTHSGAEAEVTFAGGSPAVRLVRTGKAWQVTVPDMDERIFANRMNASCLDAETINEYAPLAPGALANLPAYLDRRAASITVVRREFAALVAPSAHASALRRLLRGLSDERRGLRALAVLGRRGASRTRLNAELKRLSRTAGQRAAAALRELRLGCGVVAGSGVVALVFRARGARICKRSSRATHAIASGPSPGGALDRLRRVIAVVRRARRALAHLQPPQLSAPAFADALRLTALSEREFLRIATAVRARDAAGARKSLKAATRLATRAANGFARVGIPGCAAL